MNAVVDTAAFPAVALALPAVAVMGDAGKFPAVASMVASAADPMADAVAFPAVALAIPTAAVMGDAGMIPTMASAVASVADAVAISAVASAIPTAVVGWDAGKIPTVASVTYVAVDAAAIPAEASAIPAGAVVGGASMTWEDDSTVGDGGDEDGNACSTDSFSGFSDPGGRFAITNESVHYHHRSGSHLLSDGYSCHGRVEQVNLNENLSQCSIIPPWVHVFAKSTKSTSLRTQAASIAYIEEPLHKKARHRRNRRAKKKQEKQHRLLTEVIVPESITPNLLTDNDIYNDIVVVDGGDLGNPYTTS